MRLLIRSKKRLSKANHLSREKESRIVAALGRGNISLQMGNYLTSEDIEVMRRQVNQGK